MSTHGGHAIRGRMWCFTLNADEDKGEHVQWPQANARNPPLLWGELPNVKYLMYQVFHLPLIALTLIGGESPGNRESPSTRIRVFRHTVVVIDHQENHFAEGSLGSIQGKSGRQHRLLFKGRFKNRRSV